MRTKNILRPKFPAFSWEMRILNCISEHSGKIHFSFCIWLSGTDLTQVTDWVDTQYLLEATDLCLFQWSDLKMLLHLTLYLIKRITLLKITILNLGWFKLSVAVLLVVCAWKWSLVEFTPNWTHDLSIQGCRTTKEIHADVSWVSLQHPHLHWIKLPVLLPSQEVGETCGEMRNNVTLLTSFNKITFAVSKLSFRVISVWVPLIGLSQCR